MKLSLVAAICFLSLNVFAGEFDNGAPEYDSKPLPNRTEADIQRKIAEEMQVACSGNLCTIVGLDDSGSGWSVSFSIGYGQPANTGTGDTIYIGDNNARNSERGYAGVTVTYRNYRCSSRLRVTPAVYQFVNTYMYNMINHDYTTKRNFSPTEQTVILFYTTMLNKVEACKGASQVH